MLILSYVKCILHGEIFVASPLISVVVMVPIERYHSLFVYPRCVCVFCRLALDVIE